MKTRKIAISVILVAWTLLSSVPMNAQALYIWNISTGTPRCANCDKAVGVEIDMGLHIDNSFGYKCCKRCGGVDGKHNRISGGGFLGSIINTKPCPVKPLTSTAPSNISGNYLGSEIGSSTLYDGDYLLSPNRAFMVYMQNDGNFVLYNAAGALWATNTQNRGKYFAFQGDGNLVVYSASNQAIWSPLVHGKGAVRLVMQNDGNLVAYTAQGKAVWDSGTWGARNAGPVDVR